MTLLNRPNSVVKVGTFWHEIKARAFTERGERPDLDALWIRDYCEIISDLDRSLVVVLGCSQISKTYVAILLMNYMASLGYRVLFVLPTLQALSRNIKNQLEPITNLWGLLDPIGLQIWGGRGKGKILFGYASTSGKSPTKAQSGLALVGGSASAISADMLIFDELSQAPVESVSPFQARLGASVISSKPVRFLGTAGGGNGLERYTAGIPNVWPTCTCPHCRTGFDLDPFKCLFITVTPSGWIEQWSENAKGEPSVTCPGCHVPIERPLETTRINAPIGPDVALHLTPLLRRGDPAKELIYSMKVAQKNGSSSTDWYQQALGVESKLQGFLKLDASHLTKRMHPIEPGSFQGIFVGIDQGVTQYGSKIAIHLAPNGLPVIQVLSLEIGGSDMIRKLMTNGSITMGLIDSLPDRTMALGLTQDYSDLELARQKYNLGAIDLDDTVTINNWEHKCIGIPMTGHLVLFEAALDGRLSFDCDLTETARKHMTAVSFDKADYKIIRPNDHNDDCWFALLYAISAWLAHKT